MTVQTLQTEILKLKPEERWTISSWLDELMADEWDRQMEADAQAGRLDHLVKEAEADYQAGRCRPFP
jgi:hypothetical protein